MEAERILMWRMLADLLDPKQLSKIDAGTIGLERLVEYAPKVIKGEVAGRLLVDVAKVMFERADSAPDSPPMLSMTASWMGAVGQGSGVAEDSSAECLILTRP